MKIIINLPKSATALAAMMLADEKDQEAIDAAIKELGMALIAIARVIEKQEKEEKK